MPPPQPSVLVVDDERANLTTFARVFRNEFVITTCLSGMEALAAIRTRTFDVIIVDQSMPEMVGTALLAVVAREAPGIGRIVCTGYPDLPEVIEAQRTGLAHYVVMKPWSAPDLRRWILHLVKLATMRTAVDQLRDQVVEPKEPK
jgi:DNA-binding NtrC family response regulator